MTVDTTPRLDKAPRITPHVKDMKRGACSTYCADWGGGGGQRGMLYVLRRLGGGGCNRGMLYVLRRLGGGGVIGHALRTAPTRGGGV